MCHLVLLMPVIGIAVFWIWPLAMALPVYLLILTVSLLVYYYLIKAMSRPVTTGQEGLIGEIGEVTDMRKHQGHIMIHGEIWNILSAKKLSAGDHVRVTGMNGLTLKVKKTTRQII